jgi:hypothetical protein
MYIQFFQMLILFKCEINYPTRIEEAVMNQVYGRRNRHLVSSMQMSLFSYIYSHFYEKIHSIIKKSLLLGTVFS